MRPWQRGARRLKEEKMSRSPRTLTRFLVLATALVAAPALADEGSGVFEKGDWPLAATERPLTLSTHMLEIRGDTIGISLIKDNVGKPVFLAPDIFFGISHRFTVGLTHQVGVCLSGTDGNCAKGYNDLGIEAQYSLMRAGNLQAMGHAALLVSSLSDPTVAGLDVGLAGRIRGGKIAIQFDPTLYVGAIGRDEMFFPLQFLGAIGPEEVFHMPVDLQYQLNFQTMVFLSTGIAGPLDGFGDSYAIPAGLGALFAINNRLDFGLEFEFPNAFGKGENKTDVRMLYGRLALRL
jgi:hypothetical protein